MTTPSIDDQCPYCDSWNTRRGTDSHIPSFCRDCGETWNEPEFLEEFITPDEVLYRLGINRDELEAEKAKILQQLVVEDFYNLRVEK